MWVSLDCPVIRERWVIRELRAYREESETPERKARSVLGVNHFYSKVSGSQTYMYVCSVLIVNQKIEGFWTKRNVFVRYENLPKRTKI